MCKQHIGGATERKDQSGLTTDGPSALHALKAAIVGSLSDCRAPVVCLIPGREPISPKPRSIINDIRTFASMIPDRLSWKKRPRRPLATLRRYPVSTKLWRRLKGAASYVSTNGVQSRRSLCDRHHP